MAYLINIWPFFSLQSQMKRISNPRQKLVLSRSKKPSTPPKMQPTKLSSLKLATLHSGLAIRQSNAKKPLNSSIFEKENEGALLLRCRSISCVDKDRLQNKPIPSLNKFYYSSQAQDKNRIISPQVHLATLDFVLNLKQRGFFSNQGNIYSIPSEILTDVITEFGQKIREEIQRVPIVHSDDTFSSKHGSSLHLASRLSESFLIKEQFSIAIHQECKQLTYQSGTINIQIEGETLEQRRRFEQAIDALSVRPDQQALSFLCDKLKYLQQEVKSRSNNIRQLSNQIDSLAIQKREHEAELVKIEEIITAKHDTLSKVQKQVQDIEGFVYRQPNKILQKEALGYKQREQELFDLAFIMDQSSIESVSTYVQESIMIPYESFKLTLSTFSSHQPDEEGNYKITKSAVDAFKTSISAVYDSTVAKLKSIIEAKFNKIRDFVGIMRRLASYTIGKREYLTEINKKMASASLNTEEHLKKLRRSLPEQLETIDVLQGLFDSMRSIYCEAEVFY